MIIMNDGMKKDLVSYIGSIYDGVILTDVLDIIPDSMVDIFIPEKNIAIDLHDIFSYSEGSGKDRRYHLNRMESCLSKGIQLITIYSNEYAHKRAVVRSRIKNLIGHNSYRIHGRKCVVREIRLKEAQDFLNKYHIQGGGKGRIRLGAFYKDRLVAVMVFGESRFDKKIDKHDGYEINRFATIRNFSCVGVGGKMLKYFEREYKPKAIITYADCRYSIGTLYKTIGFEYKHTAKPNYFYFRKDDPVLRSRVQFQKHKLKDKLEVFDPNMTEWENMVANGWDRIWDCGNMVFHKTILEKNT